MSFIAAAAIVGGTTLVGAYMSSQASQNAAGQYANAANQGIQYNEQMYNNILGQNQPYMNAGQTGLGLYTNLANSGYLTANPTMNDLTALMPNYQFGLTQGIGQTNAQINAGGGYLSGNEIQGANTFAQNYAGNALQNAFNNYQVNRSNVVSNVNALTGIGTQANQTVANAAAGTSANVSNTLSSIGNAQAAGTMGSANAYTSGLNNISNYAMLYGLNKMNTPTPTPVPV